MNKKPSLYIAASILLAVVVALTIFINWIKPEATVQHKEPSINTTTDSKSMAKIDDSDNQPADALAPTITVANTGNKTGTENMPTSLQGTEVDGEIIIDENKQLVVTYGLRRLFDYFLSLMGEETIEQINTRVENYIRSHTPEPAASRAVEIYYAYIQYLQALSDIEKNYGHVQMQATQNGEIDLALIKQRRGDMQKMRQQFFDKETIAAFFTAEDSFEDYTVAMLEIDSDKKLTDVQKQQEKEFYISRMPDSEDKRAMVEYRTQQSNLENLLNRTDELKKQGASAQDLYTMRVELVGEPAAQRLAKIDKEEEDFAQRFDTYQRNKKAIIAEFGAGSGETSSKVSELENKLFSEAEVKRLVGYEAVKNAVTKKTND